MTRFSLCRSFLVSRLVCRMYSTKNSYEEAIQKLNLLQSNKSTIAQIQREIKTGHVCTNLEDMENYLLRVGISLSKLDELSVIHVAGTKGKGSTSAMCESILRHHGLRTGLYTSPHLVAVRERIRIEGDVITSDKFAKHFHEVYDLLAGSKAHEGDMPKYFAFLTVLAFSMFLSEKVDVAIVEVGIGGIVDYTNVLRKVPVVGITALGLDHTSILGNTIEEIAEAKAGIMKPGYEAYTVSQPKEAMEVLSNVARSVQCTLTEVPNFDSYNLSKNCINGLSVDLEAYRTNASLAIQLAHAWLRHYKIQASNRSKLVKKVVSGKIMQDFIEIDPYITENYKTNGVALEEAIVTTVPSETVAGLRECNWPGRYQVIRSDYALFYMDGAHTKESMEICAKWFNDNNRYREKILIFSATGDRDVEILLNPLKNTSFKTIYFVIPTAYKKPSEKNDNYSKINAMGQTELLTKCFNNVKIWNGLQTNFKSVTKVFECVSDALIDIKRNYLGNNDKSVLITGSLHLVGAALSILDPNLSKD